MGLFVYRSTIAGSFKIILKVKNVKKKYEIMNT